MSPCPSCGLTVCQTRLECAYRLMRRSAARYALGRINDDIAAMYTDGHPRKDDAAEVDRFIASLDTPR